MFFYFKDRLTSQRVPVKALSETVSHRIAERHGTLQCCRHQWSRCSEATLNTDFQDKIQHPKVSEVDFIL